MTDKIELKLKIPVPTSSKQLIELVNILQRTIGFFKHLLKKAKLS